MVTCNMHRSIYVLSDSVVVGILGTHIIDELMNGGFISESQMDYEIAKLVSPPAPQVGKSVDLATRWVRALVHGGLTEDAAIALIQEKNQPAGTLRVINADHTDLPTDRYFRGAWEWSD
jgi:hypothetical protein